MHIHSESLIEVLEGKKRLSSGINFKELPKLTTKENGQDFSGTLTLNQRPKGFGVTVLRDEKGLHSDSNFTLFPIDAINLSSIDGTIVPEVKINLATEHPYFNFHAGLGTNKQLKNSKNALITLPFSFLQKNANCVHNGIMLAVYDGENILNTVFQISSETCAYYKFDYIALHEAKLKQDESIKPITENLDSAEAKITPINALYGSYDIKTKVFADSDNFIAENVSLYGLIDKNIHYSSVCQTRKGPYPLCDQMLLPSYSLAKSLAGTLGLSLVENNYSNVSKLPVAEMVEECNGKKWQDVSLEDLSDMATGNFINPTFDLDEAGLKQTGFVFDKLTDAEKINLACSVYPRKSKPGTRFVYHTSDTYILGKALNEFLANNTETEDYYAELLSPFLKNLGMSYAIEDSLRTEDEIKQPYTGWGMYLLRGDLQKLSTFIHEQKEDQSEKFSFLKDALKKPNDALIAIPGANIFYNNGFWLRKYNKGTFGCKEDTWVPFMSGFGGITLAFLPNNMTYYYFSDGYTFAWDSAVFAANEIKPFCTTN